MLRRPLRGARPKRPHRPRAAGRQPGRPGPPCLRHPVQGAAPAGRPGQGAAPRRADRRPGPGRDPRRPPADRRAPPQRGDDLPDDPPPGGGRAALRPGRDPDHDPAHHRPPRPAARAAVRHDAHRQDPGRAPRAGRGLCWPAGRRRLAPGRPRQLRPGRVPAGSRRTGGHPGAGRGRRRGAVDRPVAPLARGGLPGADRPGRGGGPQMSVSRRRVRAILRKELREYRHNGFIIWTMAIFPLIFLIQPLVVVFALPTSASAGLGHEHLLLYMLGIPALVPAAVAAYAVVGERQQGTLEPVLTTPIRRQEFLLGKALAALVPSVAIAYVVYAFFLACVGLFARPAVASALLRGPDLLAQLLFTPLLAGWSIWIGIAISARASDFRVAQQLGILASLPTAVVAALIAFNVIHATLGLALGLAAALLLGNRLGWRIMSATFDRERLITGTR